MEEWLKNKMTEDTDKKKAAKRFMAQYKNITNHTENMDDAAEKRGSGSEKDGKYQEGDYERCVCCHKYLNIPTDMEIEFRPFYAEGAGQLCYDCYHELYMKSNMYHIQ